MGRSHCTRCFIYFIFFLFPGVFVTYYCVTNYPQFSGCKQQTFITNLCLWSGILMQLNGHLCPGFLKRLQSRCQPRSSDKALLQGTAWGRSVSKLTHMAVGSLCSLLTVGWRHRFLTTWASPQGGSQEDSWLPLQQWASKRMRVQVGDGSHSLCNLNSGVTTPNFVRSESLGPAHTQEKGSCKIEYHEARLIQDHFRGCLQR